MSAFSNYLEDKILAWAFEGTAWSTAAPTTLYISLHTADPADTGANEVVVGATNYARIGVAATTGWNTTTAGTAASTNAADIVFPATGTVTWSGTITHVGIWDAVTGGNLLFNGAISPSKVVSSGDVFKFLAGQLTVSVT
jgi:hypothetical protein